MTETTEAPPAKRKWTCSGCEKAVEGGERAPRGWRGVPGEDGQLLCPVCNTGRYVVRAVAFPVASPVAVEKVRGGPEPEEGLCSWDGLRSQLRPAFEESTRLVNWVVQQLRAADTPLHPEMVPGVEPVEVHLEPPTRVQPEASGNTQLGVPSP